MASPEIQNLARRLVAFEAAQDNASHAHADSGACGDVAVQVIEELRLRLIRLAGVDGFRSLLSRALTLARAEVPLLDRVHIRPDGSLEGFDGVEQSQEAVAAEVETGGEAGQAGILLVAHLLELLVTFIGGPLTLRLVREAWPDVSLPDASLNQEDSRTEGKP